MATNPHDYHPLDAIFAPRNVAVIGATDKASSVGRAIMWNLVSNPFGGAIYPVNPTRASVMGIKAYKTLSDVPDVIDLAIIVTPANSVPSIIDECVTKGVRGAIIISAGFKETGAHGVELERQITEKARGKMRIIGPNCLGVMNTQSKLNATFAHGMALPGTVAFISQSGALCTAILDWSRSEGVGFSHFVSVGSMLDVNWGDLIYYLGDNDDVKSIVMYTETIGDVRSFMSAAREVSLTKPIILIKPGRTEGAAKAAASHTGSLTGSDDVVDAALKRCGVLRVNNISDLFYMSEVLARQPKARGNRLGIVTNAGGPGSLATDALILNGGALADLMPQTIESLSKFLPEAWSHSNPVDVLGDADAERYAKAVEQVTLDPNTDGTLVILTPQAMTDSTRTAEMLAPYAQASARAGKPVLASWMGADDVAQGVNALNKAGIPTYPYPDTATRIFNYMWHYTDNLHGLYETPAESEWANEENRTQASAIIDAALKDNRTLLNEAEAKALLSSYGIPVVQTEIATTEDEAVRFAQKMGYPVVLKLFSRTITHKTDVRGVHLNLLDETHVRSAFNLIKEAVTELRGAQYFDGVTVQRMIKHEGYELILGSSIDAQFGPVLLFGTGGQLVEVFKDRALGLPPLNTTLAHRMIEETHISHALKGVRGRRGIDMPALEQVMVRFSQLVAEQRRIKEIDINPLLASFGEDNPPVIALDARVLLHKEGEPLPRRAIRAYPNRYAGTWNLRDGTPVAIRPIRPEDEPLIAEFHKGVSEQSVYLRYFAPIKLSTRISHERLSRICFNDYDREIALVVEHENHKTNKREILGVGRLVKSRDGEEGEYGILVRDAYQRQGIGYELLSRLVDIGRKEGLKRIVADILPENTGMRRVSEKVGFTVKYSAEEEILKSNMSL